MPPRYAYRPSGSTQQVRVQGAPTSTYWTLDRSHTQKGSYRLGLEGGKEELDIMSRTTNGVYDASGGGGGYRGYEAGLPRYTESYDGSEYSGASESRMSAQQQRVSAQQQGAYRSPGGVRSPSNNYDGFDFNVALDNKSHPAAGVGGHRISVNTGVKRNNATRPPPQSHEDAVTSHLLYETALLDSQVFEVLDIAEVDALKKEHVRLSSKIEATQRKLALESKVRDAAQNLQRLYSTRNRPDTPQSPEASPKKSRSSLLGSRRQSSRGSVVAVPEHFQQADDELTSSVKKVDDLHEAMKDLLNRRQHVESKLLRHTAAVLAEEANRNAESAATGLPSGRHGPDDDDSSAYTLNEFDGIRDILHGRPAGSSAKMRVSEQQLADVQDKLEGLNSQLRIVISEAGGTFAKTAGAEVALDQSDDSTARMENRFVRVEDSLQALRLQQRDLRESYARVQERERQTRGTIEQQLEGLNNQLHNALRTASESQPVPGLRPPPNLDGRDWENQLQYMDESLMTMEQLMQQHDHGASQKLAEYEDTVAGLWEILQSEQSSDDADAESPGFKESFSLPAFNTRVQSLFARSRAAREQQEILKRQIQQQRELNGKSDAEKDREIADMQGKHDGLAQEHSGLQQELANVMVRHQEAEDQMGQSRAEMDKVMAELEEMHKTVESKTAERDELRARSETLQSQLQAHVEAQKESEDLESEVVRLTTELTMAKAELDSAYGTREERKGAQAAEVQGLQKELAEMTAEFQDLTTESLKLEKEREGLDATIDSLRDRTDALEAQLHDEKVRWLGVKSPTTNGTIDKGKDNTSMMVIRQEFKKMMREQRTEGVKLLRTEQDERRRTEAELRKLRQAGGPLSGIRVPPVTAGETATPA